MFARLLLAGSGGSGVRDWTRGSLSADGSPVTILADGQHNAFPGITWLDATRVLLVFRRGTGHLTAGDIYGMIGTVSGATTFSWGSAFLIYSHSEDVRVEDGVSVIDNKVIVPGRLYDGTNNHAPFIVVCADGPASLTSSSSWGSPSSLSMTSGTKQNSSQGRVHKLQDGNFLVGFTCQNTDLSFFNGVLLSTSATDWSARTAVTIATGYTELDVEELPTGTLVAHLRSESPLQHYVSTSTDHGATWSAATSLYSAWGLPTFRRLTSGIQLTVYRQAVNLATYWRSSVNDGSTWSAETLLDNSLIGGNPSNAAYATILQLDSNHALCVYAIEDQANGPPAAANIYSQVFTDSSTR